MYLLHKRTAVEIYTDVEQILSWKQVIINHLSAHEKYTVNPTGSHKKCHRI